MTIGDFSTTTVDGMFSVFSVVYLVLNTIIHLTPQAEQAACFRSALLPSS
ncbi:hypothetical protein [Streptomyces benahoarensis]|nr:hypothetical protein [Streptomyces benahoarensis]